MSTLVLRAFLLGLATGGRSVTGLAAVARTTKPSALPSPWNAVAGRRGRTLLTVAAAGELVVDKLPQTPSRLAPGSLAGRTASAVASAALLAARSGANPARVVLPAAAGALAGSFAGARWRAYAADRGWPAIPAALLEDAVVVSLAATATA
ncbi:hypothetical protein [Actinoplanes solisilvae]|uniref:hypothetical protein n=1 Tax=Actinoplanes solisilvae TaxID=2486853 RepID=UPI000FDCCC89|nr:hypothetical protein [Actinoplanes solisilvae]